MIKKANYVKGIVNYQEALLEFPNYLLVGRSNVGKSSFINALTNRKQLARVSSNPGKTITLNYYLINDSYYLVDAPGYGYARRSKLARVGFIDMIDSFISKLKFKNVLLLIDFKVGPTNDDLDMFHYLIELDQDVLVVCTKKDKVKRSEEHKRKKEILTRFPSDISIYYVSSETKEGIPELSDILFDN